MAAWGRADMAAGYADAGQTAVQLLVQALSDVGRAPIEVEAWLDFGCGHGRVLRYLAQKVDPGRVWVTDLDVEAISFCASEFGVHPAHAGNDIASLNLTGFDVIYAFSVLTHLPEPAGIDLLRFFERALNDGGVVVFTTHGEASLGRIESYGRWCAAQADHIRSEVERTGFAYRPYPHYKTADYGLAWHSADYVVSAAKRASEDSLTLVSHRPRALQGHQDAFVFQKR